MLLWVYQDATNCSLEYFTPGWEWWACRIKSYITDIFSSVPQITSKIEYSREIE